MVEKIPTVLGCFEHPLARQCCSKDRESLVDVNVGVTNAQPAIGSGTVASMDALLPELAAN